MIIRSCYRARLAGLISNIGPAIDAAPAPGMIGQSDNVPIYVRALNMYRNSRKHGERSLTKDLRRITISVNNDGYRETYRIVSNDLIEYS